MKNQPRQPWYSDLVHVGALRTKNGTRVRLAQEKLTRKSDLGRIGTMAQSEPTMKLRSRSRWCKRNQLRYSDLGHVGVFTTNNETQI